MSNVLIFSGPHGAGKDTLARLFHEHCPEAERIVRHITRPATPGEQDGRDYHFIDRPTFEGIAEQDGFVEYSDYPDCMAGTTKAEVLQRTTDADVATLVANFEEGAILRHRLGLMGLQNTCLFISPVAQEVMTEDSEAYIAALRRRMERRNRPADQVANKLAKAPLYREMYLEDYRNYTYIDNSEGGLSVALREIISVAEG